MGEKEGSASSSAEDLSRKLDLILQRLDFLEKLILEKPEYADLAASLQLTKVGVGLLGEPLKVASRMRAAQEYIKQKPIAQDEISRCIVQALAVKGTLNISAITRQVATMRGKASRRIVRVRVQGLVRQGVLLRRDGKVPVYELVEKGEKGEKEA